MIGQRVVLFLTKTAVRGVECTAVCGASSLISISEGGFRMDNDTFEEYCAMWDQKSAQYEGKQRARKGGRTKQPEYRTVNPDGIHSKLKAMKAWACWKSVINPDKKKPDKVPYSYQINPVTEQEEVKAADCTKPETWMTFEDAIRLLKSSKAFKGLQIALLPTTPEGDSDRLIGIDLDKALLPDGTIKPEYMEWILKFNTRFELSPLDGVRGFCFGHFPTFGGKHSGDIEIYQERKWLTVTGQYIPNSAKDLNNAQAAIDEFRARYFKPYCEMDTSKFPVTNVRLTDEEIISRLEGWQSIDRIEAFKQYFYVGPTGNHSDNDFDLCCMIRYWTQEEDQIDRIFRKSALMRSKWDEMRGPITYGQLTIRNALGCRTADTPIYMEYRREPLPEKVDFETLDIEIHHYKVNKEGIFSIRIDRDGNKIEERISSTPCIIIAKGLNTDDNNKTFYKLLIKAGPAQENVVWKSVSGLMKKAGVLELMEFDLKFQEVDYAKMTGYFASFLQTYEHSLPTEMVASRSGWKNNFAVFVMGNRLISKDSVTDIRQIDNPTAELYNVAGDALLWAQGVKYFFDFDPIRFKAYVSFSPIIIKLVMITNYIFDQCCGTTRLKSFSNELCASMFGHPKKLQLDTKSTEAGLVKIAEACNELPTFLDETSQNLEFIMSLIYRFANANTRVKSNQSHGLEMSENFTTVVMLTGESPLVTENSRGGHDARRVPETHGVPDDPMHPGTPLWIPSKIMNRANEAMYQNYGHAAVMFVQTLLMEIDTIKDRYNEFFDLLPESEEVIHDRIKRYYACIMTAGYILEKVFSQLGINPADPVKVCTAYFEENVLNGHIEPDYVKILRMAYDLYISDEAHFGQEDDSEALAEDEERKELLTKVGWIKNVRGEITINYRQEALKQHVVNTLKTKDAASRFEAASNQWKDLKILTTTTRKNQRTGKPEILRTTTITVKGVKRNVLQIPLSKFYEHLGYDEKAGPARDMEHGNGSDNEEDEVTETPQLNVNVHPSSGTGLNQVSSVTAGLDENIIIHKSGDDVGIYELVNDLGLSGDGQE